MPPFVPQGGGLPSGTLPGRWTQTRSMDGEITGQTFDLSGATLPLSAKGLQTVLGDTGWYETATVQDEPLLIYSQLNVGADGVIRIVQVAFPIAQSQQALNTLRLILAVGSSMAIVVAFALGWALAGTALRPIHRITQTAQAIGAERNFGRRVEHTGPADEVGQLAVTFNAMLAELESGYRQLEDALHSQRRFVADASHELRTPLTTVRGNIELLRRDPPINTEERIEVLTDTTEEVDRLIRLVNQLLVLARADAGQTLRADPIPVQALVEDVCRQARLLTPNTPIHCEAPAGVLVQGDLRRAQTSAADLAGQHAGAHAHGNPRSFDSLGHRHAGRVQRARQRSRHRAGGVATYLRTLLPRASLAHRPRRRAGAVHRQGVGGGAGRHDHRGERARPRQRVYDDSARGGVRSAAIALGIKLVSEAHVKSQRRKRS